jgi:hypothetical protein
MKKEKCCGTCIYSRWWLSATGKIKKHAGHCLFNPEIPPMPYSINKVQLNRISIWKDDGVDCPVYELNEGKPISETQRDLI